MTRDIHQPYDFFEYVRSGDDSVPPADRAKIDVAILDMNHSWPNLGHDSLVHAVLEAAEELRSDLVARRLKVRVISFDIRRRLQIPESPNGRFQLYIGTGGPGHLDPRENDGKKPYSQGIAETADWEAPLFRLFDSIAAHPTAALIAVCHSFGLMCRWSGAARPELRAEKSSGMPLNVLTDDAATDPWFSQFAAQLPDRRHFRVVDNRLFDLVVDRSTGRPIAFESEGSSVLTMLDFADADGVPRVLGVNHHPEIVDREHILNVLQEKRSHGEVDEAWLRERAHTLVSLFQNENEPQSRLTSRFTLLDPLRHHIGRIVRERSRG